MVKLEKTLTPNEQKILRALKPINDEIEEMVIQYVRESKITI